MAISLDADRRRCTRVDEPFKMDHAAFNFPGNIQQPMHPGEVVNVSANGVLFVSTSPYEIGSLLRLEMRLGSWDDHKVGFHAFRYIYQGEPLIVLGRVRRVNSSMDPEENIFKVAIEFVSVDPGHQEAVAHFIRKIKRKKADYENFSRR